jgi:hypothetical protein
MKKKVIGYIHKTQAKKKITFCMLPGWMKLQSKIVKIRLTITIKSSHRMQYKSFKQKYMQMGRGIPSFLCKSKNRDVIGKWTHILVWNHSSCNEEII